MIGRPGIIVLIFLLAAGCAPMREMDIQVIQPARITLPLDIDKLAFLNRSVVPRLLHPDSSKWTDQEYYILDTIMNNWIFQGVMQTMKASPLYDLEGTLEIIRTRRYDTTGVRGPLSSEGLTRLKSISTADAVISLDFYDIIDTSSVRIVEEYDGFLYEAYLGFYTTADWRIYDLIRDTIFDELVVRDTVDWYHRAEHTEDAIDGLPEAVTAIRVAAFSLGETYGERISPAWTESLRYFYALGGRQMWKAAKLADEDRWEEAAGIWTELAGSEKPRTAYRASFNMALVCEIEDLIIPALDWAVKSYSIRQNPLTRQYIQLLKQRYEERKKLRQQVPSGND